MGSGWLIGLSTFVVAVVSAGLWVFGFNGGAVAAILSTTVSLGIYKCGANSSRGYGVGK